MTSVIIAAFNEASVIGRNLDALLAGAAPDELDVVVAANGCTDDTAAIARRRGVRVLDLPDAGKASALNAGDAAALSSPRVYLDADITTSVETVRALAAALTTVRPGGGSPPLVAVPARRLVLDGRPLTVRAYYAIQARLPAAQSGLYGRGMIAVSAEGRTRFDRFPDVLADDLFLDSLFTEDERIVVTSVETAVQTPRRTRDLLRRLTRVRRANNALRARRAPVGAPAVRTSSRTSWLRDVVLPHPWLAPAGAVYAAITLLAEAGARRTSTGWERDTSSRTDPEGGSV